MNARQLHPRRAPLTAGRLLALLLLASGMNFPGVSGVAAAAEKAPYVSSISLSPASVTGGFSSRGTVTLGAPAPSTGVVVGLSSSNSVVAAVPQTVTISPGATTGTFWVATRPVNSNPNVVPPGVEVTISGRYGRNGRSARLRVVPPLVEAAGVFFATGPVEVHGGRSLTGIVKLTGKAPTGGATVHLSSSHPAALTVPASTLVPAGAQHGSFQITTSGVATATVVTISASRSVFNVKSFGVTVLPPELWMVTAAPNEITGGFTAAGKVYLHGRVAAGSSAVVELSSSEYRVAAVPASVAVQGGSYTAVFAIQTRAVSTSTAVTLTATYAGKSDTYSLVVRPPAIRSVTLNPSTVIGSQSSTGTVTLDGKAPAGGVYVGLSSNRPSIATVPDKVKVEANQSQASFTITTAQVPGTTEVQISASLRGTRSATLKVNPAPRPDLRIYNVTITDMNGNILSRPPAGESFRMYVNVVNGGNAAAGATTLMVKLRGSNGSSQDWEKPAPQIAPSTGANILIQVPALASDAAYDFNIYADYWNDVVESNENNNYGHYGFSL